MTNFEHLKDNKVFKSFIDSCIEAEKSIGLNTVISSIMCRRALELSVKWLYANDEDLEIPYRDNLSALVHDITFMNLIDEKLLRQISFIIKLGNYAVHNNKRIKRENAVLALRYLFNFVQWISYCYSDEYIEKDFDEKILLSESEDIPTIKEREDLFEKMESKDKKLSEIRKDSIAQRKELTKKRVTKKVNYNFDIKDISEAETRKRYIDLDLEIVGWDFERDIVKELPVKGMPNNKEKGYVDYALFGKNGLPLAVIEAKRLNKDAHVGENQAKLYADCLEREYGQRPIIYYTNGNDNYMWDDLNYPPRKVSGFYTQDELQLLINRREIKHNLEHVHIDENITNREYQLEAIKSVCESFEKGHRKALLVMATGTGKTRTAISLVDVLMNNQWVKNVLFLADRTVLVKQAKDNFSKLLPNVSCCNLLNSQDDPESSRIVFSTYPTMMNAIDNTKNKEGKQLFTPGHFDLIIIDEAHRSIYKKYKAIFEYFDGLLVGLTATPRSDIDRNTYEVFELESNVPTYVYEFEEAVNENYLVDFRTIKTGTEFLREGIKYSQLNEKQKEEYEDSFEIEEDDEIIDIEASAMFTWLFNEDTIKKVIEAVWNNGIRVDNGEKLGKTIIFAKNHKHAEKIVNIFYKMHPEAKDFVKLIDNTVNYHQTIIDDFSNKDKMPQIAVSVDMLDTGVDVPEVVNLVFFKEIKSKVKFWQMIGRGTRLCEDLYGIGKDKEYFLIFDFCGNFGFFEENPKGIEATNQANITEKIYGYKLDLIYELQAIKYQEESYIDYRKELINDFKDQIKSLNLGLFNVRAKKVIIDQFNKDEAWNYISTVDIAQIKEEIIPLFNCINDDEDAKKFDNIMYQMQVKRIKNESTSRNERIVLSTAEQLQKLGVIPQVLNKKTLIQKIIETDYVKNAGFWDIEYIRIQIRELVKFIEDVVTRKAIETNITDILDDIKIDEEHISTGNNFINYRKKLEKFLSGNLENIVINKIRHNIKLTELDKKQLEKILFEELGSNKDYVDEFGDTNIVKTVRNIVGLDKYTARDIFYKYINSNQLNMKQIKFVKMLVDYVIKNGTIEKERLIEQPFNTLGQVDEVFGSNIIILNNIIDDIDKLNSNAEAI